MTKLDGGARTLMDKRTKIAQTLFAVFVLAMTTSCEGEAEKVNEATDALSDGVVTTESGLQYIDIELGDGPSPVEGRLVTVHYTGWVSNQGDRGDKFDSSVDRGMPAPFTFKPEFYMRGWYEGISTMKVGGKRTLIIPPEVYGEEWAPPPEVAPSGSTLIFDIELLAVD